MTILLLLAIVVVGPSVPDPRLTPGVVRPLTTAEVCTTKWGTDRRHVTEAMKIEVARRYHIAWPPLRPGHRLTATEKRLRAKWEVDHRIPRDLAGADDPDNLWMQPIWEAKHLKDPLEVKLHNAVCRGELSLKAAQEQMRTWGR